KNQAFLLADFFHIDHMSHLSNSSCSQPCAKWHVYIPLNYIGEAKRDMSDAHLHTFITRFSPLSFEAEGYYPSSFMFTRNYRTKREGIGSSNYQCIL
uniref:Uncharacterized protein n=1 Tax=Salvator merianae TaxID=96440 RepID=A0A8D0CDS6_SALMN